MSSWEERLRARRERVKKAPPEIDWSMIFPTYEETEEPPAEEPEVTYTEGEIW